MKDNYQTFNLLVNILNKVSFEGYTIWEELLLWIELYCLHLYQPTNELEYE